MVVGECANKDVIREGVRTRGKKSHERSFSGSKCGRRFCITLMRAIRRHVVTTKAATETTGATPPNESPMKTSGIRKKQKMRYAIANQRYFAVVFPRCLAALIGSARNGQMQYLWRLTQHMTRRVRGGGGAYLWHLWQVLALAVVALALAVVVLACGRGSPGVQGTGCGLRAVRV